MYISKSIHMISVYNETKEPRIIIFVKIMICLFDINFQAHDNS